MKTSSSKILNVFIFLLVACTSNSQVSFGVKSGINIATLKDINSDPINRIGFFSGTLIYIPMHRKIFLQPELIFSSKGYRYVGNINQKEKTSVRLNYLNMPILIGYKIDSKTFLFLGPELGYLLSAHSFFPNKENFDVSDNYPKKFDTGIDIGLSYKILKRFGIEIRYNYGFKKIYRTDAVGIPIGETKAGNRVFQIGGSYIFSLRK